MESDRKCEDCKRRPRAGYGRWLCHSCEDRMFGTPDHPASDLTSTNMEVRRVA